MLAWTLENLSAGFCGAPEILLKEKRLDSRAAYKEYKGRTSMHVYDEDNKKLLYE